MCVRQWLCAWSIHNIHSPPRLEQLVPMSLSLVLRAKSLSASRRVANLESPCSFQSTWWAGAPPLERSGPQPLEPTGAEAHFRNPALGIFPRSRTYPNTTLQRATKAMPGTPRAAACEGGGSTSLIHRSVLGPSWEEKNNRHRRQRQRQRRSAKKKGRAKK